MSTYKIRIPIIVLTAESKKLFLKWALEGFKFPKLPHPRYARTAKIA
jgi:hypothetical protein